MEYEWDPKKAVRNFQKHGVRFAEAVVALEDDLALTLEDSGSAEEERWITLGQSAFGNLLVVVYTWRGDKVRIISARPATLREREQYGEQYEK